MRIGVKLPHTGPGAGPAIPDRARELEAAGFDSLWVSDHVVLPARIESHYPFAADGKATWPTDTPYVEAVVTLAAAVAVTSRVRLGTAALVLPQRNPVLLAKQVASVDTIAGGRVVLGIGAGWLAEEFAALGTSFDDRGPRMVEWMRLLRDCWTGRPLAHSGGHYELPADTLMLPAPTSPIPLYVGGHSPTALRRAGRLGDGWLAQQSLPELDPWALAAEVGHVRAAAERAGRDPDAVEIVLRIVQSAGQAGVVARALPELGAAGVTEIIVDVENAGADHDVLRDGATG